MKKHIFYQKYANTPLPQRKIPIDNEMTLNGVYDEIKKIDDKIRDDEIRRKQLLDTAERFFIWNEKPPKSKNP